jgi:PAS domain S-box-containing protein
MRKPRAGGRGNGGGPAPGTCSRWVAADAPESPAFPPPPAAEPDGGEPPSPAGPPRILVVDDDPILRSLAHGVLRAQGFQSLEVADGPAALDAFGRQRPDLVLLDVMLPTWNGYEVCQRMRQSAGGALVPIVMMTGLDDAAAIERAYEAGATDFIGKPVNWALLGHRIRYILRASRMLEQLSVSETRLAHAQTIARLGDWQMDLRAGVIHWSKGACGIFGWAPTKGPCRVEQLWDAVHPDDRQALQAAFAAAAAQGHAFALDHRIVVAGEGLRFVHTQGEVLLDAAGRPERLVGAVRDITTRKQMEEALAARTRQLEAVREIALEITRELELPDLLRLITRRAKELVPGEAVIVTLWDDSRQRLTMRGWEGEAAWISRMEIHPGEGVTGMVAQQRTALVVNDYQAWPGALAPLVAAGVTAVMAEPLLCQERLLGVISVGTRSGRPFTAQDGETLALFAYPAAIAIENARLYAAAQTRAAEMEALRDMGQAITAQVALPAVLEAVVAGATRVAGSDAAEIVLWDEGRQELQLGAARGPGAAAAPPHAFLLGCGAVGTVAQTRAPLLLNRGPDAAGALAEAPDGAASLAVPILFGDRLLGILHAHTADPAKRFTPGDLHRFELLATQAAIAIENAGLFETERARREQLEAVRAATAAIVGELDCATLLERIARGGAELADGAEGAVYLWDEPAQGFVVGAQHGVAEEPETRRRFLAGILAAVRERGRGLVVSRYGAAGAVHAGVATLVAEPLVFQERLLGVVAVLNSRSGRPFAERDRQTLQLFLATAAVALENARLFDEAGGARERLRTLSRRLVDVQESERRSIARELHDEIGQILTGLNLALDAAPGAGLGDARGMVLDLISRVREMSLRLRPGALDDLGLSPALRTHIERYQAQTQIGVQFKQAAVDGRRFPTEIETAAYRITQEALTNVARHAAVHQATVRVWCSGSTLGVQVEDAGRGFDCPAKMAAPGSSGLLGMSERAALLGGSLSIESEPGAGTRVTAEFPLDGPSGPAGGTAPRVPAPTRDP